MNDLLHAWDGAFVVTHADRPTGATIYIAVHRAEPEAAAGGTRMRSYAEPRDALRDALRLSEGMSRKLAVLDLPRGGGKAVIDVPAGLSSEARAGLLDRYAALLESLGGIYQTGPDIGTTPADMDRIAAGTRHVFGTSPTHGGAGDPGPHTARGVYEGIRAALHHRFGSDALEGRSVLVQGLGDVGRPLAEQLAAGGAEVLATDVAPGTRAVIEEWGYGWVEPPEALVTACDVLAPCAVGGLLNAESIPWLSCAIVAGSANNLLETPEDAARLRDRGILYAPDFVINGGGAAFLIGVETLGWDRERVDESLRGIGLRLGEIFRSAEESGSTTDEAALELARRRLGDGAGG